MLLVAGISLNSESVYIYDSLSEGIQNNVLSSDDEVLTHNSYENLEFVWVYEQLNGDWGYYCIIFEKLEDKYMLKDQSYILADEVIMIQGIPIETKAGERYELSFGIRSGDKLVSGLEEYSKIMGKNNQFIVYDIVPYAL